MKSSIIFFSSILIFTVFLSPSCKKDDDIVEEPVPNISLNPIEVTGDLSLPESLSGISELSVISGFYSGVTTYNSSNSSGTYDITLNDNNVQLITLLNGEEPIAYTIAIPDMTTTLNISAKSTSIALVYMDPFIVNSDPTSFDLIMNYIISSPNFEILEQKVDENMTPSGLNIDNVSSYLEDVVIDVQENIFNFFQNASIGLDTFNVDGEITNFQLVNRRKRWLSVYANRYKDGIKEQAILFDGEKELTSYELKSDRTNFIVDVFLDERSSSLEVPLNDADSIVISCYGLGRNPPEIPSDEWEYGLDAIVNTLYFDFTIELFSVYSGVGNQIAIDLRGRPNKLENIQKRLHQIFKTKLIEKQFELREHLIEEDYQEFLFECVLVIYEVLSDQENAKLFYDLLKEYGIDKVLANNIIKKVLPALQLAGAANSTVNVGLLFYAVSSQEWQTNFKLTSSRCPEKIFEDITSITLSSQSEVDNFGMLNYTKLNLASLIIKSTSTSDPITDLSKLECLEYIGGDLEIINTNITSVYGLHNLRHVGYLLAIHYNDNLLNLDHLSSLNKVKSVFQIWFNDNLSSLDGLSNLTEIGHSFHISNCPELIEVFGWEKLSVLGGFDVGDCMNLRIISGFNNGTQMSNNIDINDCPNLQSIKGFNELVYIDNNSNIVITDNDNLNEISGFEKFTSLTTSSSSGDLWLKDNTNLKTLTAFEELNSIELLSVVNNDSLTNLCVFTTLAQGTFDNINISSNGYNPSVQDLINGNCSQ